MDDKKCLPVFDPQTNRMNPIYSDNWLRSVMHQNILSIGSDIDNEIATRIEPQILDAVDKAKECIRYECCQRMEFALNEERKVWEQERSEQLQDFTRQNKLDLENMETTLKNYKLKLTKAMLRIIRIKTKIHLRSTLKSALQNVEEDFQMIMKSVLSLQQDNFSGFLNKFVTTQSSLFTVAFKKMLMGCFKKMQLARNDMLCQDLVQDMHIICKQNLDLLSILKQVKWDSEKVAKAVFEAILDIHAVNPHNHDKCYERLRRTYCVLQKIKDSPALSPSTKRWLRKFDYLLQDENLVNASTFVNWDGSYLTCETNGEGEEYEIIQELCEIQSVEPPPTSKEIRIEWNDPEEEFEVLCPEDINIIDAFETKLPFDEPFDEPRYDEDAEYDEEDGIRENTEDIVMYILNLILRRTFEIVEKDDQLTLLIESIVASNDLSEIDMMDTIKLLNKCELTYDEITKESFIDDFVLLLNSFLFNLRDYSNTAKLSVRVNGNANDPMCYTYLMGECEDPELNIYMKDMM